jgi:hypothetical protein
LNRFIRNEAEPPREQRKIQVTEYPERNGKHSTAC